MLPVEIIQLNLHEVPVILVVIGQQVVKHGNLTMIGEAQIADNAFLALLEQVVENTIINISLSEKLHGLLASATTDGMQQHVIDVIDLELLERVLEHLDTRSTGLCRRIEIGEFGGDEILVAGVAAQGDARGTLAQTAAISGRCVKIVHAMLNGIVNLLIDHFLVNLSVIVAAEGFTVGTRQAHHAVAQNRDFLFGLRVHTVGHLSNRRLLDRCLMVIASGAAHDGRSCSSSRAQS